MNNALMYFLKVNIAIALFYIFYRLVFYKDTFWATRRFYLVFSILLSVVYPFISLSGWLEKQQPMQVIITNYVQLNEITVTATPATSYTFENGLLAIYLLVSAFLLVRLIIQLFSVLRWRIKGKRQTLQGIEIVAVDAPITPFSFFTTIFMNPELHTGQEIRQILIHERTHARQRHSLDVLLSEMLTITCWINPTVWLLKREIRHNLEFLADNSVIQSGIEPKNYQYHLLQLSYHTPYLNLVNKFNISPLKKRITMMNQQKTKKAGILKYSLIVPLALALVLSSNAETLISSANKLIISGFKDKAEESSVVSKNVVESSDTTKVYSTKKFEAPELKAKTLENEKVYNSVDKKPEYPGGEDAMWGYIRQNMKYPTETNIEGEVVVGFIINKYGKVEQAKIVHSSIHQIGSKKSENKTNPQLDLLDKEALRVVNSMPVWAPGEKKGKKVAVYYTVPQAFKNATKITYPVIKKDSPQNEIPQEEKVYEKADKMTQYPGGETELMHYIGSHLLYPVKAQENGIQGKVIVRFIVNASGKVTNAVVVNSIMKSAKKLDEVVVVGYGVKKGTDDKATEQKQIQPGADMKLLEKEAIRVINTLPDFIPGEIKGQKVAVYYTLPLTFVLE
jgi:outer membrane biosynthesis protein TonB